MKAILHSARSGERAVLLALSSSDTSLLQPVRQYLSSETISDMKMEHISTFLLILLTVSAMQGQNTGARATPQTQSSAPAGVSGTGDAAPGSSPRGTATGQPAGAVRGRANRRGGNAAQARTPAPAANSTVQVIGDSNGDGILDRSGTAQSPALPGITLPGNALGIAPGTPISVRLQQPVDSGHAKNGDTLRGVLASPLGKLPSGAPVSLTVVAAAPAGQVGSSGVLSLQVVSVNGQPILSQVITAEGKEGTKLLPDDAPARGTEATFTPDQPIVLPAA